MKETKKNGAAQSKAGKRDYSAFKNMYRKIPQDLRDVIVYYIGDRPLVIHEGVNEVTGEVVTAEFIRQWHMDRDREVYNNNKHLKPPADENKKKQIREWEEAHPGEKCPDSYNLSLDASFADDEGSEDMPDGRRQRSSSPSTAPLSRPRPATGSRCRRCPSHRPI